MHKRVSKPICINGTDISHCYLGMNVIPWPLSEQVGDTKGYDYNQDTLNCTLRHPADFDMHDIE